MNISFWFKNNLDNFYLYASVFIWTIIDFSLYFNGSLKVEIYQ